MTKFGTPIGAGPKGAIVVVGLAVVGVPPAAYCEPPSAPSGSGLVAAAVGAGRGDRAVAAAAAGVAEAVVAGDAVLGRRRLLPSIAVPCLTPPLAGGRCRRRLGGGSRVRLACAFVAAGGGAVPRSVSSGVSQSGSAFVDEAVAVVVEAVGAGGRLQRGDRVVVVAGSATGAFRERARRRRRPRPAAVTARKLAIGEDQCELGSHPKASLPMLGYPSLGSGQQATH